MDMGTMFTEQKWNILKCLSEEKYSPLQLAEKLDTTMANISQQLRLLEASNLVKKEKIKNRDKGKPRALFSLTKDYAYLISASDKFADKRLMKVNEHHKTILRIWFLESPSVQYAMEKMYWKVEPSIDDIMSIALNQLKNKAIIISDKKKEIEKLLKDAGIGYLILSTKEAKQLILNKKGIFSSTDDIYIIYDPERFLGKLEGEKLNDVQVS